MEEKIKVGNFVKIHADSLPGEKFWLQVVSLEPLLGRVDNVLVETAAHGMRYNDIVDIGGFEILSVISHAE